MSRKTTAALIAALGINFALAGGALMLANLNKPAEYDGSIELANNYGDTDTVAGIKADAQQGDLIVPLKAAQAGGNTRVTFTCGKKIPSGREVHEGTWDQVGGAVLYRPDSESLLAIEAVFDTRSLRTDANALTTTVTTNEKWFDIDNHPTATFTCDKIMSIDAATPSHTHDLFGSFTLNGITKPITIPAKVAFSGQSLSLDAAFTILRSDYDVDKRSSSIAGSVGGVVSEVDDAVELVVRVTASPDPAAVIAELAKALENQSTRVSELTAQINQTNGQVGSFADRASELEIRLDRLSYAQPKRVDLADIPARYTDHVKGESGQKPFDMVLVPGDDSGNISSFYIATHEVRWAIVKDWIYSSERSEDELAKEIAAGLRPSKLWGTLAQQFQVGDDNSPAMGMTRLTAEAYCKWLSKNTGRRYRLPTREEWMHALELGGGIPDDMDQYAWHAGNVKLSKEGLLEITSSVGTKLPNKMGVYDMIGSVAEWVTGTGQQKYVVGGSINDKPEQITREWKAIEDINEWSASYPNLPKSRFWYVDYYFTGIRLVCEAESVAAKPIHSSE